MRRNVSCVSICFVIDISFVTHCQHLSSGISSRNLASTKLNSLFMVFLQTMDTDKKCIPACVTKMCPNCVHCLPAISDVIIMNLTFGIKYHDERVHVV